jgi:hypothetical protein
VALSEGKIMRETVIKVLNYRIHWRRISILFLTAFLMAAMGVGTFPRLAARAQQGDGSVRSDQKVDSEQWYQDHEIENSWIPDYLDLATGDPTLLTDHGVYDWPFSLDSIGWNMQSYQYYGGTPYFHHGMDMMKIYGTQVINRSGGQVINIENYDPGNPLYWEVAVLDPDGYIWQYHHIDRPTIPQYILNKYDEYLMDPENGGFIPPDTHIGDIIYWPVESFHHIHLNILAAGGVYVNGFAFHDPLPDTNEPEIQGVGLLQNHQIHPGNEIEGDYSLYVHTRDFILGNLLGYYLPPWEISFSVDGGPVQTTWRFDTLPGGADQYAYLNDFYIEPTCGDYDCRDYYIDLGFIPDSQFEFPVTGGDHTVEVTVGDFAGNSASQSFTYTILGTPPGTPVWQDDFEANLGWMTNPGGTDTATSGKWERGDPNATYSNGPKQLATTPSGLNDLVTGRLAGTNATSYDVDGGVTSIRSPEIDLPTTDSLVLSFRYYLAHGSNSSSTDYLSVKIIGSTTMTVFEELGAANNDNGSWEINNVSINGFNGETVYLLIEAADLGAESLVEAAIDNVMIITNQPPTAFPQSVSTIEDSSMDILLTGSDPESEPLTFTVVSIPTHGILGGVAPSLTYTPTANFNGNDSFTFTVNDGWMSSEPVVVDIQVTPVNDAPIGYPQSVTTRRSMSVAITLNGMDFDGDILNFTVTNPPAFGALSGIAPDLIYTPTPGYTGLDIFSFVVNDGELDSVEAEVNIRIDYGTFIPAISK